MLLFAPSHSAAFGRRVADCLGVTLASSEEREYGGGEHKMRPLDDVLHQDVFVIQSLCADEHATAPALGADGAQRPAVPGQQS